MISTELNLAEATVKRHLANVYQKVGVRSSSEATRLALMEQWIGLLEITEAAPPMVAQSGMAPPKDERDLSLSLFTGVRGRGILRTSYPRSCIAPVRYRRS